MLISIKNNIYVYLKMHVLIGHSNLYDSYESNKPQTTRFYREPPHFHRVRAIHTFVCIFPEPHCDILVTWVCSQEFVVNGAPTREILITGPLSSSESHIVPITLCVCDLFTPPQTPTAIRMWTVHLWQRWHRPLSGCRLCPSTVCRPRLPAWQMLPWMQGG